MDGESQSGPSDVRSDLWQAEMTAEELHRLAGLLEAFAEEPFLRLVARSSLAKMYLEPGHYVLDAGCGSGILLPAIAAAVAPGGTVLGVDYNTAFLEAARRRVDAAGCGHQVALLEADIRDLPSPDDQFDAAHVERVLMHVDNPDQALRELRRVVRPGGRVVVAEPDYGAVRVDHPDQEAMRQIIAHGPNVFRNPEIGLELKRRMVDAGFVGARLEVLVETENDLHPYSLAALERSAEAVVAAGELPRERAMGVIDDIRAANERGTYAYYDHMVVTVAQVPPG